MDARHAPDALAELYAEIAALQATAALIANVPESVRAADVQAIRQDLLLHVGEAEAARNRRNRALAAFMGLAPLRSGHIPSRRD